MRLTGLYVTVHDRRLAPAVLVLVWRRGMRARMTLTGHSVAQIPSLLRAARAWCR